MRSELEQDRVLQQYQQLKDQSFYEKERVSLLDALSGYNLIIYRDLPFLLVTKILTSSLFSLFPGSILFTIQLYFSVISTENERSARKLRNATW